MLPVEAERPCGSNVQEPPSPPQVPPHALPGVLIPRLTLVPLTREILDPPKRALRALKRRPVPNLAQELLAALPTLPPKHCSARGVSLKAGVLPSPRVPPEAPQQDTCRCFF